MILAGDVGGTKTLLGLYRFDGARLRPVREKSFPSQSYPSFEALAGAFLGSDARRVRACAVGVAGPVVAGRSGIVNLPWTVDARRVSRELRRARVRVLNDLEASALGIPHIPPRKLVPLTRGVRPDDGNRALIAAGTGLGMSLLVREGAAFRPCASEGGHQSFAPRDEREVELWRFLSAQHGRVSSERLVSGPGLSAIFEFFVASGRGTPGPALRRELAEAADPNQAITSAALAGTDPLASQTLELFVSLYGAVAGDLALVAKATGGLFVGGGIAPRIVGKLREGEFLRAFRDKGRLSPLMARIPVRVILEPRAALLGAASCAAAMVRRTLA